MAYKLRSDESLEEICQRIAREQVSKAIDEIDDDSLNAHETVHQVRKRCKKVRGLLRLFRFGLDDQYSTLNEEFRDAARTLSPVRDSEAVIETYDDLMEVYGELVDQRRLRSIRNEFERRRDAVEKDLDVENRISTFRAFCDGQLSNIESWQLTSDFNTKMLVKGLRKTYRRGRKEMATALETESTEEFHEWRKRVKYHWYHMRILRDVWPPIVRARRDELDELSDLLGDEHDLATLRLSISDGSEAFGDYREIQATIGLIDQRRNELRAKSRNLGRNIYAEKPSALAARFSTYLNTWDCPPQEDWSAAA